MIIQIYTNVRKFMKNKSNSIQNRQKIERAQEDKTSFPKEEKENPDLYKPVLNKIMTRHECKKYNFIAHTIEKDLQMNKNYKHF